MVSVIIKTCRIWRERRWISFLEPEEPEELEEVVQRQERLKQCQLRVEPVVALKMLPAQPQVEETPGGGGNQVEGREPTLGTSPLHQALREATIESW